ncbi:glycerol-3-phosphate dehydrogenase/oxidase [Brevibacterium album]|uniref:glycerol-3-phosphate dehydrogenase/oxidase n=1 Tax=Brevibacterium album TaxID=417948 RepID=UPI00040A8D06|nr:glycerol-3-phosphate dehydrogenase/oxidase [Brevibacterium album]
MRTAALSPEARSAALRAMTADTLDVLVIGGGIVGAGAALDAATRGLRTGLVEARDFASGTSSRSSRLIHGGLRYLEMLDFRLVAEALAERSLLLDRLAPHLVRPVPFLYPLTRRVWERGYVSAGLTLYDSLGVLSGRTRGVPRHRQLTRAGALRMMPGLRGDALVGAVRYFDAQVDDARYTMTVARTAATFGAHVATRTRVTGLLREGGRVCGAEVCDLETGERAALRARQVISATGVWTDEMQAMSGRPGRFRVRASKGIHLVVPRSRIPGEAGLILRTEASVLFVIPWEEHWIIGTTDTPWELSPDHPAASSADIDYLLGHVNRVLAVPLTRDDVEGVYAGLRPLLAGESDATSRLSREHAVSTAPGLVLVAGGKYTTYRRMAADAVDAAAAGLSRPVPASCTAEVPLAGADGFRALWNQRAALAARHGVGGGRMERLLRRYGSLAPDVLALAAGSPDLGEPLTGAPHHLRAEIVYGAAQEGARHLDDVLARRTRISVETPDRGTEAAEEAARLMGEVLGWSAAQRETEVEHYLLRVAAERESQMMPDDETADAARMGAPDVVPLREGPAG